MKSLTFQRFSIRYIFSDAFLNALSEKGALRMVVVAYVCISEEDLLGSQLRHDRMLEVWTVMRMPEIRLSSFCPFEECIHNEIVCPINTMRSAQRKRLAKCLG